VVVNVLVPRRLTTEQAALLEEFAAATSPADYELDRGFFDKVKAVFRQ